MGTQGNVQFAGNEGVDVVGRVTVQSVSDEVIDAKPDLVSDVSECLFQLHELLELLVPYDLSQSLPGGGFQGGHQKNSWGHFESLVQVCRSSREIVQLEEDQTDFCQDVTVELVMVAAKESLSLLERVQTKVKVEVAVVPIRD